MRHAFSSKRDTTRAASWKRVSSGEFEPHCAKSSAGFAPASVHSSLVSHARHTLPVDLPPEWAIISALRR